MRARPCLQGPLSPAQVQGPPHLAVLPIQEGTETLHACSTPKGSFLCRSKIGKHQAFCTTDPKSRMDICSFTICPEGNKTVAELSSPSIAKTSAESLCPDSN